MMSPGKTLANDTFYEAACKATKREYLMDEDLTLRMCEMNLNGWATMFKALPITALFSTSWLANRVHSVLPVFRPGRFVLHYSMPLPPQLKLLYCREYVRLCEERGDCGYIFPPSAMDEQVLRRIGVAP